jgi:hypothetical protein
VAYDAATMVRARGPLRGTAPLLVVLAVAAGHMAIFDRGLGGDGWATFAFLESVVEDHDTFLENNCHGVRNGLLPGPDGHLVMQYPPGVVVLDAVPFLAGRAADRLLPAGVLAAGVEVPPVGRVPRRVAFEVAAIVVARNLEVLVGLAAVFLALRRLGSPAPAAGLAVAMLLLGGPLAFYALVGMTHAPVFALAALLLLHLARHEFRLSGRAALLAGLLVGAAVLVRYDAAVLAVPVLAALDARRLARGAALALGGLAVPLLALPPFWRLHYDRWLPLGYGGSFAPTPASPWNVLLAWRHGAFLFHPVLLLACVGLVVAWLGGGERPWRRAASVGLLWFVTSAIVHGFWSEWANAGGWGQRFVIDALPPLAIGLAALFSAARTRRWAVGAGAAATVFSYVLFFAAVGRLARASGGEPWPQTLADYAPLLRRPPSASQLVTALERASLPARLLRVPGPTFAPP